MLHKIPPQEKLANRSVSIFTPVFNLFKKVSIMHNSPITNSKFKIFEKKKTIAPKETFVTPLQVWNDCSVN